MKVKTKRSIAEVNSLKELMWQVYDICFVDFHLIHSRENDVYKLSSDIKSYILKIYPVNVMHEAQLRFINKYASLAHNNSYIVRTKSGKLKFQINYPEGERVAVLFEYINNEGWSDRFTAFCSYGKEIAKLHSINLEAPNLEKMQLLSIKDKIISVNISGQSKNKLLELLSFVERFSSKDILHKLEVGLCHGDCHIENSVNSKDGVKLIDMDSLRSDYFFSDIASILWANHYGMGVKDEDFIAFIKGYLSKRPLFDLNEDTLLYFIIKKELSYIITYLKRQDVIGELFVNSDLVMNRLLRLNEFSESRKLHRSLEIVAGHF